MIRNLNFFPLIRDGRLTELDMIDISEMEYEHYEKMDFRKTLRRLATRVGQVVDGMEEFSAVDLEVRKNAERWHLLFGTEGVSFKMDASRVAIFQDSFDNRGKLVERRLLAIGSSIPDAVDKALGFN